MSNEIKISASVLLKETEILEWLFNTLRENEIVVYDTDGYLIVMKDGKNIGKLQHTQTLYEGSDK